MASKRLRVLAIDANGQGGSASHGGHDQRRTSGVSVEYYSRHGAESGENEVGMTDNQNDIHGDGGKAVG